MGLVALVPDTPVDDEREMRVTLRAVGADNFVAVAGVGRRGGRCWEARNFSVRAYLRTYARHALMSLNRHALMSLNRSLFKDTCETCA